MPSNNSLTKIICVYCSSSDNLNPNLQNLAFELGRSIAVNFGSLLYGASQQGLMHKVAQGALDKSGYVYGVFPKGILKNETPYPKINEIIYTVSMRERRKIMEERSDAFVVLPGGLGTLEEFSEIMVSKMLSVHNKPLIFLNYQGFFDPFFHWIEILYKESFISTEFSKIYQISTSVEETIDLLNQQWKP